MNLQFDVFSLSGNETDRVEVFDGGDNTAPALGVFTGNHVPPPLGVNSSSNTMFIVLRSSSTSEHVTGTNGGNFRALFAKRGIFKSNRSVCAMRVGLFFYVCMHACMYACMYVYMYMCVCLLACLYVCLSVFVCLCGTCIYDHAKLYNDEPADQCKNDKISNACKCLIVTMWKQLQTILNTI